MARARLVGMTNTWRSRWATSTRPWSSRGAGWTSSCAGACGGWRSWTPGDQFLALSGGCVQPTRPDDARHFGLVVDDRDAVRAALDQAGTGPERGRGLQVRDPWGNVVEIVDYREVQFSKAPGVLAGMGLEGLEKTEGARRKLAEKGLNPPTAGSRPP